MKLIDKQQAMTLILGESKAVNGEEYLQYYRKNINENSYTAYETDGCIAIKNEHDNEDEHLLTWRVHAVNSKSDILSAFETVKRNSVNCEIYLYVIGDVPVELLPLHRGMSRRFTRIGEPHEDNGIRKITADDRQTVEAFCIMPDEDWYAKSIAEGLLCEYDYMQEDSDIILLGAFDDNKPDTLAGLISLRKELNIGKNDIGSLAVIGNLLVRKEYRRQGYAKRLISAACGVCPGIEYSYNAAYENIASIASAEAAGFKYAGAFLYLGDK